MHIFGPLRTSNKRYKEKLCARCVCSTYFHKFCGFRDSSKSVCGSELLRYGYMSQLVYLCLHIKNWGIRTVATQISSTGSRNDVRRAYVAFRTTCVVYFLRTFFKILERGPASLLGDSDLVHLTRGEVCLHNQTRTVSVVFTCCTKRRFIAYSHK